MMHVRRLGFLFCALFLAVACQGTKEVNSALGVVATIDAEVTEAPRIPPPATIKYTGKSRGEAPYRNFHLDITFKNRRDHSQWFVIPFYGDTPLPSDDMFTSVSAKILQFKSHKYDGTINGGEGVAMKIAFIGQKRFIAFRAKPKATIRIRDLVLPAKRRFTKLPVWEVREISVNSETKLERYLPYKTYSDTQTDIRKGTAGIRMDLKDGGTKPREDFPKKGVHHIWVKTYDKWDIEVDGI